MDKNEALWGALKLRSDLAQGAILPADEVRATGAFLGFDDAGLLTAATKLAENNRVRLHWGGNVEVLEPRPGEGGPAAGPIFSGNFYGPVGYGAVPGASFDQRGSGQGATYNEAGAPAAKLEEIVAGLAAAAAELRARAPAFPAEEAAQVQAVAEEAGEVAREAQKDSPDKPGMIERLNKIAAGTEALGKLQVAVEKLGPTLTLLRTGAAAAVGYFAAGG